MEANNRTPRGRGVAAVACITKCKPRKRARKGPVSPEKRAHGGKATSSVGLTCGLDRNYKRFAMFENGARHLADPEHTTVCDQCTPWLRGGIGGDQELLQKELDLMRKPHSAISMERFLGIERDLKLGAFALVDNEDALATSKCQA
jgi:hypothetical protein